MKTRTVLASNLRFGDLTRSPVGRDRPHWRGVESVTAEDGVACVELTGGRVLRIAEAEEVDVLVSAPDGLEVATSWREIA